MLYVWNDFSIKNHGGVLVEKPASNLKLGDKVVKPGETFEMEPSEVKKLGIEKKVKIAKAHESKEKGK